MTNANEIPENTPWGEAQTTKIYAPGIVEVTTAGHGGIWLSPERNAQVPMQLKLDSFCQQGLRGWYEEDEDAGIVRQVFPQYFQPRKQSLSDRIRRYIREQEQNARKPSVTRLTDEQVLSMLRGDE